MTDALAAVGEVLGALAEPFTSTASRTWWPFLLGAAGLSVGIHVWRALRSGGDLREAARAGLGVHLWGRSAVVDVQLLAVRQLLGVLGVIPRLGSAWALATLLVRGLDRWVGRPELVAPPTLLLHAAYTALLFVAWDFSRYLLHRLLHTVPALWQFHQVHHSAEVLTPLTFHRVHPVESVLYELRGVLVTGLLAGSAFWLWRGEAVAATVLGVDAIGFVLSGLTGNLRHSHVWIRFGPAVERWLLSPAQHQLHHAADVHGVNYGVWLAVWDRLGGSLRVAGEAPPARIGLLPGEANHAQDALSALVGPFVAAGRVLLGRPRAALPVAAVLALVPGAAHAQEGGAQEAAETTDDPPPDMGGGEELVIAAGKVPTAGGAAHEVDAETLERYEHDDIQRVLARVPGVYVRGEDGFGLRPNIGMRGANSDRSAKVTLLEDGVPVSPAPYAAPAAYYFPLTTRLVGVEVFKGPAAIAHGPQTIGGAVNLLTRKVPDGPAGELDASFGQFSTVKMHGWGGTGGPRGGVLVEAAHLSTDGFKELDGGGPTGFERQDLLAKGRLVFDGETRNVLELKLGYGREHSYETYLGLSLADFEENPYRRYAASAGDEMRWQHTNASLSWDLAAGRRFSVRTVAYHNMLDRQWTKLNRFSGVALHPLLIAPEAGQAATYVAILRGEEDSVTTDQVLMVGTNDRLFHNMGVQSVAKLWAGGGKVSNVAELGVRVHGDIARRVHTEDAANMVSGVRILTGAETETLLDMETDALALSGWLRDQLEIGPLHVVPGVRVEHMLTAAHDNLAGTDEEATRTEVLPGVALSVEPTDWLMAFGGVHRGFSPLAPGEDPDAVAESAWNAELGARLFPGMTYVELVGYGSAYQNLSGQCTLSSGCSDADLDRQYAAGEVLVAGVEAVLSHEILLPRDLSLVGNASYTYTWSSFRSDFVSLFPQWGTVSAGDRLPYVPEHQGSLEVLFEAPRGSVGVTGTWRGAMRDVAGQGEIAPEALLPASFVLDVAANVHVTREVKGYVILRNVTDTVTVESLRPFGARPGAPRTLVAGVKITPRQK